MEQTYKDETRWLTRMLAIIFVLLALCGIVGQYQQICVNHDSISFIAVGIIPLFFWLGYRLWRCTSLWNIFLWFSETSTVVLSLQFQYYRINKHIRGGLVAGVISLMMVPPFLPVLFLHYKGIWFWDLLNRITHVILWPLKGLFQMLDTSEMPKEYQNIAFFLSWIIYTFAIGFLAGALISYLAERLIDNRKHLSAKDLNNGSPGCSEAEPGD